MTEIIVAGFPKSGNTWLTRLLSDALDYPVAGIDDAIPLAADQQERNGDGVIRQLHLLPTDRGDRFVANCYTLNVKHYSTQRVIHIIRDPRDVAVSIDAYWGIGNLDKTIVDVMALGQHPLWGCGWPEYISTWRATELPHLETRYEWLHEDTALEIRRLCDLMGVKIIKPLDEVIQRNEISTKRQWIKDADDNLIRLPHGKGAQLTNLRAGRVGDWQTSFTDDQKKLAFLSFQSHLIELGYESSPLWWCSTQTRNEASLFQMLRALYDLTDTGAELCSTLYKLTEHVSGDIVEVGAGRGRTAIALGWRNGNHVISVDNFADNEDWAHNIYGSRVQGEYLINTRTAGVKSVLDMRDVREAAAQRVNPVGLWFWDISSRDRLLLDWQAWREHVRGRAVIRDTFDQSLGSRDVLAFEAGRGEFEIERDDPGILILRRV